MLVTRIIQSGYLEKKASPSALYSQAVRFINWLIEYRHRQQQQQVEKKKFGLKSYSTYLGIVQQQK